MKKALLLLASAALLLVGCAKEPVSEQDGGLTTATITAGLDNAVATRAIADNDGNGTNVTRCIMEIYYGDQLYKRLVQPVSDKTATFSNVSVVAGKKYRILFWADCGEGLEDKYFVAGNLKSVKIIKDEFLAALQSKDNDKLDAFFFSDDYTVPQGGGTYSATLTRPFAQLNVITTDVGEGNTVTCTELLPEKVSVSYTGANEINVATGEVSGSVTYAYEASVYGAWETVTSTRKELTLSMDYILTPAEKSMLDVIFKTKNGDAVVMNHSLTNLPCQRNYRTNVKGQLLTVGGTWSATISPNWIDSRDVNLREVDGISSLNEVLAVGANDVKVTLPATPDGSKVIFTSVNNLQDIVLSFTGSNQTVTFTNADGAAGPKSLTITAPAGTSLVFEKPQQHVVINGTTYDTIQGVFSANTLVISEGVTVSTLKITAGGLEIHGTVNAIGEGLTNEVKVRACEGLSNDVYNKLKNYIDAPVFKAVQKGEKWDIVAADKTAMIGENVYYNISDALTAAQNGQTIKLLVDLSDAGVMYLPACVTFDGDGHQITGASPIYINANGGTVKNVVFKDLHNDSNKQSAVYAYSLAGKAEISGCTFDNCDWDAIQITTNSANADIVITGNEFKAVDKTDKQNRFIHIQTDNNANVDLKAGITGNRFSGIYNLKNAAIELYCPTDFNKVNISGNYLDGNKISVCIANKENDAWTNHIESAKNWLDASGQSVAINAAIRADEAAENILLCTTLASALQESASWAGSLCIMNEAALRELSTLVNGGTTFAGKKVSLVNDIDLNNVPFTPIGSIDGQKFEGTLFDGCNHTISNLKIEVGTTGAALFGYMMGNKNGETRLPMLVNLTLKNVDIKSTKNAAAFVAYSPSDCGTIDNCHVDGGTIVSVPHAVSGGFDDGDKVGGIAGQLYGGHTISNCSVKNLSITAFRDLGGVIGHPNGKCYITNNTVENVTIFQSRKNAYGTYDTVDEIAGRDKAGSELTNNTCTNVVVKQELADGLVYIRNEKLYEVSKVPGLLYFRDMVTGGKDFAGETVKLTDDINLASIDNYIGTKGTNFAGTFDGNGHTISNLKIQGTEKSTAFLGPVFGATIKNLTITGANVTSTGADYTGILASNGYAHFDNCKVSGTVSGIEQVGAIIGYLSCGHIKDCVVDAAVSASQSRAGILTGKANVDSQYQIEGNTIKGSATSNDIYAGGVVGQIMCGTDNVWTIKNNSIDATVSNGGSLIGNVRSGYWEAFQASYQENVTGNTWTASADCTISDGTNSVTITK